MARLVVTALAPTTRLGSSTLPLHSEMSAISLLILVRNWSYGYTLGMKTAISIPNDLFDGAERLARRTRRSRSRLFTDALREYLARHAPDKVTESMDQAIMEVGEEKDEFVSSVARRRLERTEW